MDKEKTILDLDLITKIKKQQCIYNTESLSDQKVSII